MRISDWSSDVCSSDLVFNRTMCLCEEHVMLGRFEDQSVLITGAAGAIGWATAQRLALEGASVTIWDVDDKLIAEAQTEIQRTNYQIRLEQVDLLDAQDRKRTRLNSSH